MTADAGSELRWRFCAMERLAGEEVFDETTLLAGAIAANIHLQDWVISGEVEFLRNQLRSKTRRTIFTKSSRRLAVHVVPLFESAARLKRYWLVTSLGVTALA